MTNIPVRQLFHVTSLIKHLILFCIISECLFSYFSVGFFPPRNYFLALAVGLCFLLFLFSITRLKRPSLVLIDITAVGLTLLYILCGFFGYTTQYAPQLARYILLPYCLFVVVRTACRGDLNARQIAWIFLIVIVFTCWFAANS